MCSLLGAVVTLFAVDKLEAVWLNDYVFLMVMYEVIGGKFAIKIYAFLIQWCGDYEMNEQSAKNVSKC